MTYKKGKRRRRRRRRSLVIVEGPRRPFLKQSCESLMTFLYIFLFLYFLWGGFNDGGLPEPSPELRTAYFVGKPTYFHVMGRKFSTNCTYVCVCVFQRAAAFYDRRQEIVLLWRANKVLDGSTSNTICHVVNLRHSPSLPNSLQIYILARLPLF